ncbi:MAG: O-acetyl-ADP-ribose deacetylase [Proteobacteria bacterium]|nr:O-acetyl-ADP-ribose deacetylase [Pseudomonadota bacterium]MBU1583653.1 O-acetyl-ADP-ribose deacetylase [Pseudomonadota bacterium]MBU2453374.1 O-acetyl-ADP-ribose deacetylase [Pseudomonadota bacterium]MBU2628139.1 O-acetyl-ADP-ribose deacetylase [Pseudomonadota bacterium]
MDTIKIVQGDITQATVDAIVNAANSRMLGGGGVDGAIHRAAGPKLLAACEKVKTKNRVRCPVGEARLTEAGNLKAKYVIHAVGPRYGIDKNPENLLTSAYQNSLDLAVSHGCESIAFPAISCGVYGYPPQEAAKISVSVCKRPEYESLMKYFYLFSDEMTAIWMAKLEHP